MSVFEAPSFGDLIESFDDEDNDSDLLFVEAEKRLIPRTNEEVYEISGGDIQLFCRLRFYRDALAEWYVDKDDPNLEAKFWVGLKELEVYPKRQNLDTYYTFFEEPLDQPA